MSQSSGRSRRVQRAQQRRRKQQLRIGAAAAMVVVAVIIGVIVLLAGDGGDGDSEGVVEVDLFEFGISGDFEVTPGPITLAATNTGEIPHNVGIRGGPISNNVDPGDSLELELGELGPGNYELYCDLAGHEDAGMVADFVVIAE